MYVLVLPALTLDQEEARNQGGVDVTTQQTQDVRNTGTEADDTVGSDPGAKAGSDAGGEKAEAAALAGELAWEGEGYQVTAAGEASLPEDATLTVTEITEKDQDYQVWTDEALKAMQESGENGQGSGKDAGRNGAPRLAFAKFYDITLTADGEAIEPNVPVDVRFAFDQDYRSDMKVGSEADAGAHLRVIHFAEDADGNLVPEVYDPADVDTQLTAYGRLREAAFTADSFSVYGIVYTVDFAWEVDGETYEYNMDGGTSIRLGELLPLLGAVDQEDVDLFLAGIADVTFSDRSLVNVEKTVSGDWILQSLQPFDTDETLTITMKNGDVVTIKVRDAQHVDELALMLESAAIYEDGNLIP